MDKKNFKVGGFKIKLISILIIPFLTCLSITSVESTEIAPENSIKIVNKASSDPEWKQLWDSARESVRRQDNQNAISLYKRILNQKPNIEEVKWELCKVYILMNQFEEASLLLESLLEIDSSRVEYLVNAGDVALMMGKNNRATSFFGQALENDPTGSLSNRVLEGFIDALVRQGEKKKALPLMEQLYVRGGASPELLRNIAEFHKDIGELKKSGYFYRELVEKYRVEADTLFKAAKVLEELGQIDEAVVLWKRYLELSPEDLDLHEKLLEYYLSLKLYEKALPHLNILLDHSVNREKNLLEAGKIFLFVFGRADKALAYYENYQKEFPEGTDVSEEITNIQLILANDFLSIVENDGVWMLWRDLARVTPDRIGIYRTMADLLEELGKEKEFIEVLQIINMHAPGDLDIKSKLSRLYLKNKLYRECLVTLNGAGNLKSRNEEFLLLKAECKRGAKDEAGLLNTLVAYLALNSSDVNLRIEAINLAGGLGDISTLKSLVKKTVEKKSITGSDIAIIKAYLDGLVKNHMLYEAEKLIDRFVETRQLDQQAKIQLFSKKAGLLEIQGDIYEAEQKLRENAAQNPRNLNTILDLAEYSLRTKDITSSSIWLKLAERIFQYSENEKELIEIKSRLVFCQLKHVELMEGKMKAAERANLYMSTRNVSGEFSENDMQILLFLIKYNYQIGKFSQCKILLENYSKYFKSRNEIVGSLALINEIFKDEHSRGKYNSLSIVELFSIYELLIDFGNIREAKNVLYIIDNIKNGLTRTIAMLADINLKTFNFIEARRLYNILHKKYPNEIYYEKRIYETLYLSSDVEEYISKIAKGVYSNTEGEDIIDSAKAISSSSKRRQIARSLWTLGRWKEALQVYADLEFVLKTKVQDSYKAIKEKIREDEFSKDRSLWGLFDSSEDDSKYLHQVMHTSYFSEHLEDDIAVVSSSSYASYKWLSIIRKEHEAKKSLNNKEFYQAEKDYQELIEDEDYGDDIYPDMATIYSRLGRYAKETEMIEQIKEMKLDYPGIKPTVEQNTRQRRPQLSLDGIYLDQEGRDGYKDIRKWYSGMGLRLQPTIFQEFGINVGWAEYGNSNEKSLLKSIKIAGEYSIFFSDSLDANLKVGVENMEDEEKSSYLSYDFTVKGRLEESVQLQVGTSKERVTDTIAALEEGLYQRGYGAGLTVDYLPYVFMGFDFDIIKYNDSNDGKRFKLWASYRVFSDTSMFDFSYHYEKFDNAVFNDNLSKEDDIQGDLIKNYWSPGNYWRHIAAVEYKRELWPIGKLYSGTSYLSAKYGIGYESYENVVQLLELNIFLEIHPMFLLKGTFVSDWTEGYDRNEGYASFVYRW